MAITSPQVLLAEQAVSAIDQLDEVIITDGNYSYSLLSVYNGDDGKLYLDVQRNI